MPFKDCSDDKIVAMGQKNMHQRVAEIILELPMHFETLSSGFIDVKLRREVSRKKLDSIKRKTTAY